MHKAFLCGSSVCISTNPTKEKRKNFHPFINGTPLSRCNACHFKETKKEPRSIREMKLLKKEELLKIDQKSIVIKERRDPLMKKKMNHEMEKELKLRAEAENDENAENVEGAGDENNKMEAAADQSDTEDEGSNLN